MAQLHYELLDQSEFLARLDPRRPKQANLRRSVSAAYYAVFHALAWEFARCFRSGVRSGAVRVISHGIAKNAAREIVASGTLKILPGPATCPADLVTVADDFVRLQVARNDADYSLSASFDRKAALAYSQRARRAVGYIEQARETCPKELQAFLLALVVGAKNP